MVHDPRRTISADADHRVTEAQCSIWSSSNNLSQRPSGAQAFANILFQETKEKKAIKAFI